MSPRPMPQTGDADAAPARLPRLGGCPYAQGVTGMDLAGISAGEQALAPAPARAAA